MNILFGLSIDTVVNNIYQYLDSDCTKHHLILRANENVE